MSVFVTSDLYFGREAAAQQRNISSVEEMNEQLIKNWNSEVTKNDLVYCLGNFAFDPITAEYVLTKLNGSINFILGEWDTSIYSAVQNFTQHKILNNQILLIDSLDITVSYWPLEIWPGKDLESIHIHGGSYSKTNLDNGFKFNSSIDNWSLKPLNIDLVMDLVKMKKETI